MDNPLSHWAEMTKNTQLPRTHMLFKIRLKLQHKFFFVSKFVHMIFWWFSHTVKKVCIRIFAGMLLVLVFRWFFCSEWALGFPLPSPDVSRSQTTGHSVTDQSITWSKEAKRGQGQRESTSSVSFKVNFMENKSDRAAISSSLWLFTAYLWP